MAQHRPDASCRHLLLREETQWISENTDWLYGICHDCHQPARHRLPLPVPEPATRDLPAAAPTSRRPVIDDFLDGDSLETIAHRYTLRLAEIEQVLRKALRPRGEV
jgi:hypothetical protein